LPVAIFFDTFLEMVANRSSPEAWCLLYLDGHPSRINPALYRIALQNRIYIQFLPAHSSTCVQPLDTGVNTVFKSALRKYFHMTDCPTATTVRAGFFLH
jgi:hypothetical protein